jgi:hypothetical protein
MADNPADIGSRGGSVENCELWWNGPTWLSNRELRLSNRELWPPNLVPKETLRVCVWISRFLRACRGNKRVGPILTTELEEQRKWWIRKVQQRAKTSREYLDEQLQLNLQENDKEILECRGRIQGSYPVYLPDKCEFVTKLVEQAHRTTLHGGMGLTITNIREEYWIPRLRRLVKRVIKSCRGCNRFQVCALNSPPPGLLPKERTQGSTAFKVVGVDFAGPIRYRRRKDQEDKCYLILFAWSLSRALHLELLLSLETVEFLGALRQFIARCGRPSKIF